MPRARPARARARPRDRGTAAGARTVRQWIDQLARRFSRARLYFGHGTDNARDEAAWLVGHVARRSPATLSRYLDATLSARQVARLEQLAAERIRARQPLAYLLREAWFAGLRFYIDPRVIVPRSLTTEFITERFAPWVEARKVRGVLDLCTGSGCMAIALARAFPKARVDAVDISAEALAVARINVRRHRLTRRVRLVRSDLFAGLAGRRYDLIVSNPPYVAEIEMRALPAEYRHEPALALTAPDAGLAIVLRILAQAEAHLTDEGVLVVETGNSHARLQRRLPQVPFVWLTTSGGDESIFLISAAELRRQRQVLRAALKASPARGAARRASGQHTLPRSARRSGGRSRRA